MQLKKKRKESCCFGVYLRLLSNMAAVMTAIITTAAAIATYLVVGIPLVGCCIALREGEVDV